MEYDYERVEEIREGTEEKIRGQISIFEIAFHVSVRTLATCFTRMIKVICVLFFYRVLHVSKNTIRQHRAKI